MEVLNMKKIILGIFVFATGLVLLACNSAPAAVFADADDIYAFQAVSAAELLIGSQEPLSLTAQPLSTNPVVALLDEGDDTTDEPIVAEEIDQVDKYLTMMEQFLGQDNGLLVTVEVSDNTEYANKIIFTTRNLAGEDVTYTLYYNEVLYEAPVVEDDDTLTTTEATTDETTTPLGYGDGDHQYEFQDESDDEILYSLSGILVVGDVTYNLEGKKVVEENEEVLILRAYVDHDNFVKVTYKTEENLKKFTYEVMTDGVLVNKAKVRVETDTDGSLKAKLEFVEGEANGKYEFKQEVVDNVTYIKVKYEVESAEGVQEEGMIHITATYDEATDTTTYEYVLKPEGKAEHRQNMEHENRHGEGHGSQEQNGSHTRA
jgi:hypothetical protein